MLFYPAVTVVFASVAYLLTQFDREMNYDAIIARLPDSRLLDALLYLSVVAVVLLSRADSLGLSLAYYWTLPVVTLAFAVRILIGPSRTTLFQILLFAVVIRAAIWFSAPAIGVDSRVHLAIAEFVARSGHLPPTELSYYHWYPFAHVTTAVVSQLSVVSTKSGFFLTTGVYATVSIAAVYLFTDRTLQTVLDGEDRTRAALFAALLLAVAPWHVRRSGLLIAQSMGIATIPFALYAAMRFRTRQYVPLFVVFLGLTAFTHNLTPIVISALLFTLLVAEHLVETVKRYVPDWRPVGVEYGFPLVFATGVLTIQYWIYIEYFDLQVLRLVLLLSFGSGLAGGGSVSSLSSSNAFTLKDPFLHVGIEQLVFGALLILFGFVALGKRRDDGNRVPMTVFLTACAVFLIFSATLLLGNWTRAVRVLPAIVLVVAPAFGFLVAETYGSQSVATVLVVGLLISLPVSGGIAATFHTVNPGISPTEEGGARLYLSQPEYTASEHVLRWGSSSATYLSTDYLVGTTNYRLTGRRADVPESATPVGQPMLNGYRYLDEIAHDGKLTRRSVIEDLQSGEERYFLDSGSVSPSLRRLPPSCSVVYDAGNVRLITC